jgi:hypothetical protein
MTTATRVRGKTGEQCQISGKYEFDGYVDGSTLPAPSPAERKEPIAKGNIFPPIRSAKKSCFWLLTERI